MNTRIVFLTSDYLEEIVTIEDEDSPIAPPKGGRVVLNDREYDVVFVKHLYTDRNAGRRSMPVYELDIRVTVTPV